MKSNRLGWLALCFCALAMTAWAQVGTGTLRGVVSDPSGATVPGASVTATGEGANVKVGSTNQQGLYSINGLAPGKYTVRVLAKGFNVFETQAEVGPAAAVTLNASLAVSVDKQEVTVSDTFQGGGRSLEQRQPTGARKGRTSTFWPNNPDDLHERTCRAARHGPSVGPNGGQIYIDGFTGGRLPPKESIREIRINSNPFSAEYDKLGYGRIEIFTKPGTDKYHGNAFYNYSSDVFNSRNPFSATKVPYDQNYWGGNFSGPVNKKSSFFIDFDRRALKDNAVISADTLDPSLNILHVGQAVVTPNNRTTVSPRFDYQLSPSNTLVLRYTFFTKTDQRKSRRGAILTGVARLLERYDGAIGAGHRDRRAESAGHQRDTLAIYPYGERPERKQFYPPAVQVLQTFTGGGASLGYNYTHTNQYEANNSTSFTFPTHTLKVGGRLRGYRIDDRDTTNYNGIFTFPSLNVYQQTLLLQQQGVSATQIRAQGFGPSQFTVEGGNPIADVNQFDLGFFAQDDWRLKPKFTLSLGIRYETQNIIHDRKDWAPRVGIAWGLGGGKNAPKTVLRIGYGFFYDRFTQDLTLNSMHVNGIAQQQYIIYNPNFYPTIPNLATLTATPQAIWRIDSRMHAPYVTQGAVGVDRQLPRNTTVSVTYANSHGVHQLRARDINAPLPGTFIQGVANSGVRPYGNIGDIYQYEGSGLFNQQQLITNFNSRISTKLQLFGYFTVGDAHSNTDGATTFPANQYDESSEYSRAAFDARFHTFMGGTITAPLGLRFAPYISQTSSKPFNIVLGQDVYGDTLLNARPAFAIPGLPSRNTPWGDFYVGPPVAGETIIPRNYGIGPSQFSVNLRVSRTWGFGPELGGPRSSGGDRDRGSMGSIGRRGGGPSGGSGRSGRGGGGGPPGSDYSTSRRYNLTASLSARNLFNHENFGTPIGNLNSPLFGESNTLTSSYGGSSSSGAGNRRIEMRLMFTF